MLLDAEAMRDAKEEKAVAAVAVVAAAVDEPDGICFFLEEEIFLFVAREHGAGTLSVRLEYVCKACDSCSAMDQRLKRKASRKTEERAGGDWRGMPTAKEAQSVAITAVFFLHATRERESRPQFMLLPYLSST